MLPHKNLVLFLLLAKIQLTTTFASYLCVDRAKKHFDVYMIVVTISKMLFKY